MPWGKTILGLSALAFSFAIGFWYGIKSDRPAPGTEISHVYIEKDDPYAGIYRQALKKKYQELSQQTSAVDKNTPINLENINFEKLDERNLRLILGQVPADLIQRFLEERKDEFYTNFIKPREPKLPKSVGELEDHLSEGLDKFEPMLGENARKEFSASTTLKTSLSTVPVNLKLSVWAGMPIQVSNSGVSHFEVSDPESKKSYNNLCFSLQVIFPSLDYHSNKQQTKCLKDLGQRNKEFVQLIELKNSEISKFITYLDVELPTNDAKQTSISFFDRSQNNWVNHSELIEWKEENSIRILGLQDEDDFDEEE